MKSRMSSRLFCALLFVISILLASPVFSQQRVAGKAIKSGIWKDQEVKYVDGEIAIKLKEGFSPTQLNAILNQFQAKIKQDFDELRWGWIVLPESTDIMPTIAALQNSQAVEVAEPNFLERIFIEPNDPYFRGTSPATYPYQWALKNTGQSPPSGTNDADIDAPEAWDITTGNSNVIIAILDTGIPMLSGSLSHPDLNDPNKIILGPDYIGDGEGVRDLYGHGTHVAGIAAAETNNSTGIAGVAWNCKLMVIQVFDAYGNGTSQTFYNGVKYAVDYYRNNPTIRMVINYSGGGSAAQQKLNAVIYANTYGVTIVAAAGNDYGDPVIYPAAYSTAYSNVIAVSSTDHTDTFSAFSNQGPEVNISAPGGYGGYWDGSTYRYNGSQNQGRNIFSTTPNYSFTLQYDPSYPDDPYNTDISQNYGYLAGTSMAAPHVSGSVALLLSIDSSLSPSQLRDILQQTADDKGPSGFDNQYGYGRINAYNALYEVLRPEPPTNLYISGSIGNYPRVNWTASASSNIDYYKVYRRTYLYPIWGVIATTSNTYYVDTDYIISSGGDADDEIYYKATAVDVDGLESDFSNTDEVYGKDKDPWAKMQPSDTLGAASAISIKTYLPTTYSLGPNYPNPFNPSTEIKYALPEAGHITLSIFNIVGQRVRTVVDEQLPAGYYNALWDSKDAFGNEVASGVYLYRIYVRPAKANSKPFESLKKMTLLR